MASTFWIQLHSGEEKELHVKFFYDGDDEIERYFEGYEI